MPIPTSSTQRCRDCGQDLPVSKFSRGGRTDGYRRPECRSCQHKRSQKTNPNYQYTSGAIAARAKHKLSATDVARIKRRKLEEQGSECVYCLKTLTVSDCDLDHRLPLARGGKDTDDNLQALCARCNGEKHAKSHEEYIDWLRANNEQRAPDRRREMFL